jgi:hypothetical protein
MKQQIPIFYRLKDIGVLDIKDVRKDAERRHQEVLHMTEKLSEAAASEKASIVRNLRVFHKI